MPTFQLLQKISDISLETLEKLTKHDLESFILYLRERPRLNNIRRPMVCLKRQLIGRFQLFLAFINI
jgi:hypothetical protein